MRHTTSVYVVLLVTVAVLTSNTKSAEFFGFVPPPPPDYVSECGPCDRDLCPSVADCAAGGTVWDRCGCCHECAKQEQEVCEHPEVRGLQYRGKCREGMECRLRKDISHGDQPEATCVCTQHEMICGSDDVTYDTPCQLSAVALRTNVDITVKNKGPCTKAPTIINGPQNVADYEGSNVAIACEAVGYPIPTIEWVWTRVDGKTVYLPGDDLHISVNMRGGSEKWQVTGWLQVMDMEKQHEGNYTCIVQNDLGVQQSSARINVIKKESMSY